MILVSMMPHKIKRTIIYSSFYFLTKKYEYDSIATGKRGITMTKVSIQNLGMIITNDCNLNCDHCMRGEKCKKKMSQEVIEHTFKDVVAVSNLCICGGEPLLALDVLESIFNYIIENRILVSQVTLVTNGTIYSDEFLRIYNEMNDYVSFFDKSKMSFHISYDDYHVKELERLNLEKQYIDNYKKYKESKFFGGIQPLDPKLKLFREGNAEKLPESKTVPLRQMGYVLTYVGKFARLDEKNGLCNIGPLVTVNTDGILTECDASLYHQATLYNYGNVLDNTIHDIVKPQALILKPRKWYKETCRRMKEHKTYNN